MSTGPTERLQKALSQLGLASRREAEEWIRAGRLTINGETATLGARVGPDDQIRLDGRPIRRREPPQETVFVCHRSPAEAEAFVERLPRRAGRRYIAISPMPRVDGGLELFASGGEVAEKLQRSVQRLAGEYSVRVRGEIPEPQLARLRDGLLDSGERVEVLSCEPGGGEGANRWYQLSVRGASGKDVRQLFERHGAIVSRVLRTRLGPVLLDRSLARGRFRPMTAQELDAWLAGGEAQSKLPPVTPRAAGPRRAR